MKQMISKQILVILASWLFVWSNVQAQEGKSELETLSEMAAQAEAKVREMSKDKVKDIITRIPKKSTLTDEERRRISGVQKRFGRSSKATITRDGWISIPYGETPTVFCGINGFCMVELEPGEIMSGEVQVSDRSSWEVQTKKYGPNGVITAVSFKPLAVDIYTQVNIFTNKGRVYDLFLDSSGTVVKENGDVPIQSMRIRYRYSRSSDVGAASADIDRDAREYAQLLVHEAMGYNGQGQGDITLQGQEGGGSSIDVDTDYIVKYVGASNGDRNPPWKPIRVHYDNAAVATYIEMPKTLTRIPSVYALGRTNSNETVSVSLMGDNRNILRVDGNHPRLVMTNHYGGKRSKSALTAFEIIRR